MSTPRDFTLDELKSALCSRIRRRRYKTPEGSTRDICYLELRSREWGEIGTPVIRNPEDRGWPDAGETTDDEDQAKRWISAEDGVPDKIAQYVKRQLAGQQTDLLVADAVEPFIDAMHEDEHLGPDHSTVSQRRSYLRVHIAPKEKLGSYRLATLRNDVVQSWVDGLTVVHTKYGVQSRVPASKATREAAVATLKALYRHHFPGQDAYPWGRIVINLRKQELAHQRAMVRAGRGRELILKRVYTPEECFKLLLTARYLDRYPGAGGLAMWACRNLAPATAFQICFASRIGELVDARENGMEEDEGFALIAGTKSESAIRYIPLQNCILPWLAENRAAKTGPVLGKHYLLRTHPYYDRRPNKDVYARRMGLVQKYAGLKIEGQRSHIYRRTHASWANMAGIPPHEIKLLLGHAETFGGATDDYIEFIRQLTRPEHRTYIQLPSPTEVDALLDDGWRPPNFPKGSRGGRR